MSENMGPGDLILVRMLVTTKYASTDPDVIPPPLIGAEIWTLTENLT